MNRTSLVSTLLCMLFFSLPVYSSAQTERQPNIVYILADDMGIGDVSSYNADSKLYTTHIDRLAQNGVKFTDAHTSSAVCTPTRYGILTGRYNWRSTLKSGVLGGYSAPLIPTDRLTVASMLQESGYHTAFVGKWHLGWDWAFTESYDQLDNLDRNLSVDYTQPILNGPKELGFGYSYGFSSSLDIPPYVYVENGRVTSLPNRVTVNVDDKGFWREGPTGADFDHTLSLSHLTDKAISYIDSHSEEPFFLYFPLPAPHTPILPLTEFMGKSNTNMYGDFVLQVDDVVGRITKALEERGLLENTILIFTSDNGCSPRANYPELARAGHNPSGNYRGHKADIYEGGHRVPFIVHWPAGIANSGASESLLCTTDLMATLADLVGYSLPNDAAEDSFSFLPALQTNGSVELRPSVVHHSIEGRFAIRKGPWKLILWPGSGGWSAPRSNELEGLPPMQLYRLDQDPGEQENLIALEPQRVVQLKKELVELIRKGRSTSGIPVSNDGPEVWQQLGWMDD
ncbi:MAG: arylsulfatase [Lunatimonas sp.]|uniref:sulfatase family protein n=1 Tax=Lunatimonas sp. TaxID=2060141 RepID=UPI00263B06D9|nr:arylsulfatase [Lunatimonas sp.]MCC5936973.1 arylsulfatase [Lunatimonas sp.]